MSFVSGNNRRCIMNEMSRATFFAILTAATLIVSGCGGGSGDNGGDVTPGDRSTDLSTKDAVSLHVGSFNQIVSLAGTLGGKQALISGMKAASDCQAGGTTEEFTETKTIKSLVDGQERALQVSGTKDVNCKDLETADEDTTELVIVTDGREESGGDAQYSYRAWGPESLYRKDFSIKREDSPRLDFELTFRLRTDSQAISTGVSEKSYLQLNGEVSGLGFSLLLGSVDTPFSVTSNGSGGNVEIVGDYAFGSGLAGCDGAKGSVRTLEPLTATDTLSPADNLFSAGKIEISADGKKATVTYSGDNVIVTDSSGNTSTISASDTLQAAARCGGSAFVVVPYAGED